MKLADAAKVTAMTKGRGLASICPAMATAKGNTSAAAALFVTVSVNKLVIKYTPASIP